MNSPEVYLGVSILKTDIGGQHCFKIDAYESTEILPRFILEAHLWDSFLLDD
ncbi:MAG: hypothetical protein WC967_01095 [Balneolaceae bacterium]